MGDSRGLCCGGEKGTWTPLAAPFWKATWGAAFLEEGWRGEELVVSPALAQEQIGVERRPEQGLGGGAVGSGRVCIRPLRSCRKCFFP